MLNINGNIGTAKDNQTSPLHDWYRFTAGFSYKLVDEIIKKEKLTQKDSIFESFAGCGTTLVTAQKSGIKAFGNEGQELLFDVIRAKLNWKISENSILKIIEDLKAYIGKRTTKKNFIVHNLLPTLYSEANLNYLCLIRDFLNVASLAEADYLFLKLALTQTLHKCSIHPISVPYIVRSKILNTDKLAIEIFLKQVNKMLLDLNDFKKYSNTSEIFLHDSRVINEAIETKSCSSCITSPPYLNNLDYGEVSKVCSHFFGLTNSWNEITDKVRKKLVTGSTTHYKEADFKLNEWKKREFYISNTELANKLILKSQEIYDKSKDRGGKKSYNILMLLYFNDMYLVLKEIYRVLKLNKKAYLVLGDSAPYGVYIDTTTLLGEIAQSVGFSNFEIQKLRVRGTKWQTLTHRHSLTLSENILILKN